MQSSIYYDLEENYQNSQIITRQDLEDKLQSCKMKGNSKEINLINFTPSQSSEYEEIDSNQDYEEEGDSSKSQLYQPLLNQVVPEETQIIRKQDNIKKLYKEKILQQKKTQWSWDTTGALIRLMKRRAVTRRIANIYICILMLARVFYAYIMIRNIIQLHEQMKSFIFFWGVLIVYITIRFLFMAIVYKVIKHGKNTNDRKIKIVFETYILMIDDLITKLLQLQNHPQKPDKIQKLKEKKIQREILKKQILMIVIPAEFQFLLIKFKQNKLNGYYQAQNFIMKSLEIFFFMPFLIYFIRNNLILAELVKTVPNLSIGYLSTLIVLIDLSSFIALNVYLLTNNQSK